MSHGHSRRAVLASVATLALAGCTGDGPATDDGASGGDDATDDGSPTTTDSDGDGTDRGTDTPALDLREANVTDVTVAAGDGGTRFSVTLYHDDDGEDGYADWWQVETPGGERLGRRELLHAHSTAPFTRSETVEVPEGTTCVAVRGHDQTHGYGGQAMLVDVTTGARRAVRQGEEPDSFAAADCP